MKHPTTKKARALATAGLAGSLVVSLSAATYGQTAARAPRTPAPPAGPGSTARLDGTASSAAPTSLSQIPFAVKAPAIPGAPGLPGPVAGPASPSANMGILSVQPDQGPVGTPVTVTGKGLPAGASVELTWSTSDVTWLLQPEPGTVNYRGRASVDLNTVLTTVTAGPQGQISASFKIPQDWGGVHDIYAVVNGVQEDHGGFMVTRTVSISPTSGPIGTPVHITYNGLGPTLYTGGASLLYDNHYVGEMMANWTRGKAEATIRATGAVGPHTIQVGDAISFLYMNLQQSPVPYATGGSATFDVTKDAGRPPASIDWPVQVAPTVSARTTLQQGGLAAQDKVTAELASTQGPVDRPVALTASGFSSSAPVQVSWATVVGSRVDCKSTCWDFASTPLGTVTPANGSLSTSVNVPDGLGGWHVVQLTQGGKLMAQLPFYVQESIVGQGVSSLVLKEGQPFTIHLKGVGWTQVDNTIAVDYDNSYMGYGCGFNSNGDVVLQMHATGAPGTHLIDIYPMLYSLSPSFANTPYGMVPILTYAQDDPALALGYHLPSLHFAITVVK